MRCRADPAAAQTARSSAAVMSLKTQDESKNPEWQTWNIAQQTVESACVQRQPRVLGPLLWGTQCMTQHRRQVLFIYFLHQGQAESADSSENRSNLQQGLLPKRRMFIRTPMMINNPVRYFYSQALMQFHPFIQISNTPHAGNTFLFISNASCSF